jgi:hypothetical protein
MATVHGIQLKKKQKKIEPPSLNEMKLRKIKICKKWKSRDSNKLYNRRRNGKD